MMDPERWERATVTARQTWAEGLFTLRLDVARTFQAGQFVKLARWCPVEEREIHRAYSIASAPGAPLEFFVVRVDEGELSPCLHDLQVGQEVHVARKILGGFTLERIPDDDARHLWMVATGTGLAPFISMLRQGHVWSRFDRVVLFAGARHAAQLAYLDELRAIAAQRPLTVLAAATRDDAPGVLRGRVTDLLTSGALEEAAGVPLVDATSHVMMCGNPEMVDQLRAQLADRGMALHTPRRHGHVHLEKYW